MLIEFGIEQGDTGYWVVALDGGGRPREVQMMLPNQSRAELEALIRNKAKKIQEGTIGEKMFAKEYAPTWLEWFDLRINSLQEAM